MDNILLHTEILSSLLDDDYIRVPVKLAKLIGLNEAIVLRKIHEWVKFNSRKDNKDYFYNEYYWTHQSYKEFVDDFPWWSARTVQRTIKDLEDMQVIVSAQPRKIVGDCTKWYRVDVQKLIELYIQTTSDNLTSPPVDKMASPPPSAKMALPPDANLSSPPVDKMASSIYKDSISKKEIAKEEIANTPPIVPHTIAVVVEEERGGVSDTLQITVRPETRIIRNPNGSEQFPWEKPDPIETWVIEEGFLKYVWPLVKHYTNFKNLQDLSLKKTARALKNFINKAHYEPERREVMLGHWDDYQDELNGVSDVYSNFTASQAIDQIEEERIHNASKRKFEL